MTRASTIFYKKGFLMTFKLYRVTFCTNYIVCGKYYSSLASRQKQAMSCTTRGALDDFVINWSCEQIKAISSKILVIKVTKLVSYLNSKIVLNQCYIVFINFTIFLQNLLLTIIYSTI